MRARDHERSLELGSRIDRARTTHHAYTCTRPTRASTIGSDIDLHPDRVTPTATRAKAHTAVAKSMPNGDGSLFESAATPKVARSDMMRTSDNLSPDRIGSDRIEGIGTKESNRRNRSEGIGTKVSERRCRNEGIGTFLHESDERKPNQIRMRRNPKKSSRKKSDDNEFKREGILIKSDRVVSARIVSDRIGSDRVSQGIGCEEIK